MALKKKRAKKKAAKKRVVKKKVIKKRPLKKRGGLKKRTVAKRKKAARPKVKENVIGTVTHYFPQVRAAVIKLKATLAVGDNIKIKGHTTDLTQAVTSMQIDRVPVDSAVKGKEVGLLVESRVRQHDLVYKV